MSSSTQIAMATDPNVIHVGNTVIHYNVDARIGNTIVNEITADSPKGHLIVRDGSDVAWVTPPKGISYDSPVADAFKLFGIAPPKVTDRDGSFLHASSPISFPVADGTFGATIYHHLTETIAGQVVAEVELAENNGTPGAAKSSG